jgi:prevent-host-death family protein
MDSNEKGAIAEHAVALKPLQLGIPVLRPSVAQLPYDLAFELKGRLWRVQCKWASVSGNVIQIRTGRCYHSPTRGYVRRGYTASEADLVAAYCAELETTYVIPIELAAGKGTLQLRLTSTGNNQLAAINWAADFELGAIAQLEERLNGIQEAEGSSPSSSTPLDSAETTLGAHEYRNRFGWYMQRASQGEGFLITRRGRPFARLIPPDDEP